MVLLIILGCLVVLLAWLVLLPIRLVIHTNSGEYRVEWGRLIGARLIFLTDDVKIRMHLPFFHKDFYPLHPSPEAKKKEKPTEKKKKKKKRHSRITKVFPIIKSVLRSFYVRQFKLELDTDNYLTNAYLYPLFYFLNKNRGEWHINYSGQFALDLEIMNRPVWILFAIGKTMIKRRG